MSKAPIVAIVDDDEAVREGGVVIGLSGSEVMTTDARTTLEHCGAKDIQTLDTHEESATDTSTERGERRTLRSEPAFGERREPLTDDEIDKA